MVKSIKIVSDGTPWNTEIYDEKSGIKLSGIKSLSIDISYDAVVTATVTFVTPKLELNGTQVSDKDFKLLGSKREIEF